MQIKIKDYDLRAGQQRLQATYSRELGLGSRSYDTDLVRTLRSSTEAIRDMQWRICRALERLPIGEGGVATLHGASAFDLSVNLPLVKACLLLAAHNQAGPIGHSKFVGNLLTLQDYQNTKHDAGPVLDELFQKHGGTWNLKAFETLVWGALVAAYGEETCDSEHSLSVFFPGSHIDRYADIIAASTLYDFFGAFDPTFTRQDALVGEWWLIQPVSPRLKHRILAERVDLKLAGYLPPSAVDIAGRVVMCCYREDSNRDDAWRLATLRDDKFVAGVERVVWRRDTKPLSLPNFDLLKVTDFMAQVPETDNYGPYKHASELPPWGVAVAD